jgi:hypothetical protein
MPVRKFHSVDEMTSPLPPQSLPTASLRAATALSRTCLRFDHRRPPAGVHKYRSADEAWEARLRWERERSRDVG